MTPRQFDPAVVERKLRLLDELLTDLEAVGPIDAEQLRSDRLARHAVERLLTQLVQIAVDASTHLAVGTGLPAPTDYRSSFLAAATAGAIPRELAEALLPSVGLRNLLVHEYASIDLDLVAAACGQAQRHFRTYLQEVSRFLRGRAAAP